MSVTIQNDAGVTFTFNVGDVDKVVCQKIAGVDVNTIPGTDSDSTFVVDFNGVSKKITVEGRITEASTTRTSVGDTKTIAEQVAWLESLADGTQTGYVFSSTFQSNKTVYLQMIKFEEVSGDVTMVPFSIEFVEGA